MFQKQLNNLKTMLQLSFLKCRHDEAYAVNTWGKVEDS